MSEESPFTEAEEQRIRELIRTEINAAMRRRTREMPIANDE